MQDQFFKWASNLNIGYIVRFHEFLKSELRRKEDELNQAISNYQGDQKGEIDLLVERDLYASTYNQFLMSNTFLLLYSHLEEWLFHIWKTYASTLTLQGRGSISRFGGVVQQAVRIDVSRDENWQFLLQAEKVRNCLLHANARIDLSKNFQQLRKLVSQSNGGLIAHNLRLLVQQPYIENFFKCAQFIISRVENPEMEPGNA
jgi:hypothetical protein